MTKEMTTARRKVRLSIGPDERLSLYTNQPAIVPLITSQDIAEAHNAMRDTPEQDVWQAEADYLNKLLSRRRRGGKMARD